MIEIQFWSGAWGGIFTMPLNLEDFSAAEKAALRALEAVGSFSRARLTAESHVRNVLAEPRPLTQAFKDVILELLQKQRMTQLVQLAAERLLTEGSEPHSVLRVYAQALLDEGSLEAGACMLHRALTLDGTTKQEAADMFGMMGRVHKQRFVDLVQRRGSPNRQNQELQTSVDWYLQGSEDYHLINAVALIRRAEREKRPVASGITDLNTTAEQILQSILDNPEPNAWHYAMQVEASIALNLPESKVMRQTREFIGRVDATPFELNSLLRQCMDIWQLDGLREPYTGVVNLLRNALFERQGGPLDVSSAAAVNRIQSALDKSSRRSPEWFWTGAERAKSVARVRTKKLEGSGFLVDAAEISSRLDPGPVFITNAHVVEGAALDEIELVFHALDENFPVRVTAELHSSPAAQLDYVMYAVSELPEGVTFAPIAKQSVVWQSDGDPQRVYAIGHPGAGPLSVCLYNNALVNVANGVIHYTAATEPGSSGSPVFNEHWEVIGLHHGRGSGFLADGSEYDAQEGILLKTIKETFEAIMDQARLEPIGRTRAAT